MYPGYKITDQKRMCTAVLFVWRDLSSQPADACATLFTKGVA